MLISLPLSALMDCVLQAAHLIFAQSVGFSDTLQDSKDEDGIS